MAVQWYVIHSKPHREEALSQHIKAKGIEYYYPRLRVRPVNPRSRTVRPYFPGYLFVHADLEAMGESLFQWMPEAVGLVSFGGEPATVPDQLLQDMRHALGDMIDAGREQDELVQGDQIIIQTGPFAGYQAIFDRRLAGNKRARVLLEMLRGRSISVDLNTLHIKRA